MSGGKGLNGKRYDDNLAKFQAGVDSFNQPSMGKTRSLNVEGSPSNQKRRNSVHAQVKEKATDNLRLKRANTCPVLRFKEPEDDDLDTPLVRKSRRTKTVGGGETELSARISIKLSQSDEDHILRLHTKHVEEKMKATAQVVPYSIIDAVWGTNNGGLFDNWCLHGKLPLTNKERPHSTREHNTLPDKSKNFLQAQTGIVAVNTKGKKGRGDTTIGQDNFSISQISSGWMIICVFDGHGPKGHWPATTAARTMPFFLQGESCSVMLKHGKVEAALCHAYAAVQNDLEIRSAKERIDVQVSGCTGFCAMYNIKRFPGRMWVAYVGDSRAMLVSPTKGLLYETEDHKPLTPGEKERLESSGCTVEVTQQDNFVEQRVYITGTRYPGLCMSRSLGDLLVKNYGVIAEPEVHEWDFTDYPDAFLLAASDGLWEFLSSEQVVSMLNEALASGEQHRDIVTAMLMKSRELWRANEGDYCDDITILLCPLDFDPGIRGESLERDSVNDVGGCCYSCTTC